MEGFHSRVLTLEGDCKQIESHIEELRQHDKLLADHLASLANNFDHKAILALIEPAGV